MAKLEPTRGSEMQKTRPIVILSSNTLRPLPVRIIVPLTDWREHFVNSPWKVRLEPNLNNKLSKPSAADCLVRCLSVERLLDRRGRLPPEIIQDMIDGLNYCLED